jgi:hypothetical protein
MSSNNDKDREIAIIGLDRFGCCLARRWKTSGTLSSASTLTRVS